MPESAAEYHRGALGFAIQAKGSRVERHFHSVYDLTPERVGTYDLVFCASVLLHLTDPLRAMYGIRRVCRDQAIISTGIDTHIHVANQVARHVHRHGHRPGVLVADDEVPREHAARRRLRARRARRTFHLKSVDGTFDTPHGTLRAFVQ